MFSLGTACSLNVDSGAVPPKGALLMSNNSLSLENGAKIRIKTASSTLFLNVVRVAVCSDDRNRDNITVGTPLSETTGHYKEASAFSMALHSAWGTKKARISAVATGLSITSAAGASINASTKNCQGLSCVSTGTWVLIGISALAAMVAWAKDNEVF
jgi:hypothetical protein